MRVLIFLFLIALFACEKNNSPEETLTSFVNYRFEKQQDLEHIKPFLTDKFFVFFNDLNLEARDKVLGPKNILKKKFKILIKKCETEEKCFVTYYLNYLGGEKTEHEVELKKIAEMVLESDGWKINDVTDVKTFVDFKDQLKP